MNESFNSFEECISCGCAYLEKEDITNAQFAFFEAKKFAHSKKGKSIVELNLGISFAMRGDYRQACNSFYSSLMEDSNNIKARQMLGMILEQGDLVSRKMAEDYLRRLNY